MPLFQSWQQALLISLNQVVTSVASFIPNLVGAVIIFAIGVLVANWGKKLAEEVVRILKIESLSKTSGFSEYLIRAEIKMTATELVGSLVKWLLLLVFFIATVDVLKLPVVSRVLSGVLGYIPNILAAALIFGAGFFVANLVDGLVRGVFATIDHEAAKPVGRLARWVVLVVSFFAAVDQLQVAKSLIDTFFQGLTWTLVLIVGLSIGLGSKDLVAKVLDDWYKRLHK